MRFSRVLRPIWKNWEKCGKIDSSQKSYWLPTSQGDKIIMAERYLSASEAIEELGLPASTFYRLVKEKKIEKLYPSPVSKHGVYDPREIARLKSKFRQESYPTVIGETDWIKGSDMGNVYNLEYKEYGDDTGDPSIIRKWYEHNPHMCRVLYNKSNRNDLWGAMNMVPMQESTIFKLLKGEIRDIELNPQTDILTFDNPGVYNFYVASVIIDKEKRQHFPVLINSVFDFWVEQAPERTIGKIYGKVITEAGELMAKKLFFSPMWEISDNAYVLDMNRPNPSRLIQTLQYCIKQKREEQN